MNELILMMWLVDVVSVSTGMGMLAALLLALMTVIVGLTEIEDCPWKKPSKLLWIVPVVLAITAWLMPSKQTLYAAIALKAGSEIAESRLGTKAINALEGVLDEVIEKQSGKNKEGAQ